MSMPYYFVNLLLKFSYFGPAKSLKEHIVCTFLVFASGGRLTPLFIEELSPS